ncbi:hypothetical protein GCM10022402_21860 [Salinactinospora qingdaonensis]|uniref:DUF3352 domain-containing protein n=1 Tax=Salinactinospora qingdaonensis TaxID=702744 RepID=A0ABP7FKC6_9ACTN
MWLIPIAVVLSLAMMTTVVWASDSVVENIFGGPQPESVLPASSMAFAKADFKPTGAQLAAYGQFYSKLPDSVVEETGPQDQSFAEPLVTEMMPGVDFATEVEPWLGRRFGVSLWPTDAPEAMLSSNEGVSMAAAVAVTDEAQARESLTEIQRDSDFAFEVRDGFALLSGNEAALDDLVAQVRNHGTLDSNPDYLSDMDTTGDDNIASAWMDMNRWYEWISVSTSGEVPEELMAGMPEFTGRLVLALRIEADYMQLRGDLLDFTFDGEPYEQLQSDQAGISALEELPANTVLGFGGGGLDQMARQAWQANRETLESLEGFAQFEEGLGALGISLPGDFTGLLGTRTALGFTELSAGSDGWDTYGSMSQDLFHYRAVGADQQMISELVNAIASGNYSEPPTVTGDGDAVLVYNESPGTGTLGEDAHFQTTMVGLEQANLGYYMKVAPFAEQSGMADADQWGAIGGAVDYNTDSDVSINLRWAPSGGR